MELPWVLLVEDNEATSTLICALLRKEYNVDAAFDGSEAMEKLRTRKYEAIILDLLMPRVDGFGVLEHLRSLDPDRLRSVIVVTAALAPAQLSRVQSYGVASVVRKPFDVETLHEAVKAVVRPTDATGGLLSSGMIALLAGLLRHRWM